MKKFITLFLLMAGMAIVVNAQDVITLKNGNEIKAKVTEITASEIKYLRFDNLEGPTIVIAKSEVFAINYENGAREVINPIVSTPPPAPAPVTPVQQESPAPQAPPLYYDDNGYEGLINFGYGLGLDWVYDYVHFSIINGYRFSPYFSMGFSASLRYVLKTEWLFVTPALHFKGTFLDGNIAPFLAVGLGYALAVAPEFEAAGFAFNPYLGVQFKLSKRFGLSPSVGYDAIVFSGGGISKVGGAIMFKLSLMVF